LNLAPALQPVHKSNAMEKKSEFIFSYPPNLQELDLATMVSMYRERGDVSKAKPGRYVACSVHKTLHREAKSWFGLWYCQKAWDALLTEASGGYPLTEAELNVLGLIYNNPDEPPHREFVEKNTGTIPKLAYLIVNDMKQFGFLKEDEGGFLSITPSGERALQGIARRLYNKKFSPEMLTSYTESEGEATTDKTDSRKPRKRDQDQTSLF